MASRPTVMGTPFRHRLAANAIADWVVFTLERPIGRVNAGWLGLLGDLGHPDPEQAAEARQERKAAIRAFRSRAGLPATAETSLDLLGRLMQVMR